MFTCIQDTTLIANKVNALQEKRTHTQKKKLIPSFINQNITFQF